MLASYSNFISLCVIFLFLTGCTGTGISKRAGGLFPGSSDRGELSPLDISLMEDGEIEFLPLIPLEDQAGGESPNAKTRYTPNGKIQARFDKSLEFYQSSQENWQQGEIENALDALDKAYALIVSTETADIPKFIQQKDDLRFMISKRILEIYASRFTTAKGNHDAIPLVMNKHIEKELNRFITNGTCNSFFRTSYQRAGSYRPYIVEELKKAGLPEELSWLPLIESGYKVKALSSARALGMWQFIASTGYKFGLKRDRYIDERLDPYKSTHAAIAYLKELHEIFGDWKTVLAAYNCGEGRVLREIRKQNINYLDDFWDLYERLPSETASYVPKFIATLHIVSNPEKYGLAELPVDKPFEFETVLIDRQASLKNIAEVMGLKEDDLTALNPELRYKVLPDDEYALKIPPQMKEILLAKIDKIPEQYQSPHSIAYHRVRPGETLSTIATKYSTTVQKIAWYNNINRHNYIVTGQTLKIPQAGDFAVRGKPVSAAPKLASYKVRNGDSLWVLAKRYNTTTKKILEINQLKSPNLFVGQAIRIPSGSNDMEVYRVKQGDSPISIAKRHNMNLNDLLDLNHLSKNSRIYPGQKLYVE